MKSDAYVRVVCDTCIREVEIELTPTGNGWTDLDVDKQIENLGWRITDNDEDRCPECVAELEETDVND